MYVFQQRIPQACTPRRMQISKYEIQIVCARPWTEPFTHDYYIESGPDGCVKIKAWLKLRLRKKHKLETSCSLFSMLENMNVIFCFTYFHLRVLIRSCIYLG